MKNRTPKLNDFVRFYNYIDFEPGYFEVGRVRLLSMGNLYLHGIAQNNKFWRYTEFDIALTTEKGKRSRHLFKYLRLPGEDVWTAVWKGRKL